MDLPSDLLLLERCLSLMKTIVFPENSQYVRLERSSVKKIGADDSRLLGLRLPDSSCVIVNYLSCRIWRSGSETILIRRCEDEFKDLISVRLIARPENKQYFDLRMDRFDVPHSHTRLDVCSVGIGLLLFTPHQMSTLFGNKLSTEQILREVLYRVVECPTSQLNTITGLIESKYNQSVRITVTLASSIVNTSDSFSDAFDEYISTLLPEEFEIPTIESDVIQYHQPKLVKYKKYLEIMTDFAGDRDVLCTLIVKMTVGGSKMTMTHSPTPLTVDQTDIFRDLIGYGSPYTYSSVVTAPHVILRNILHQMAFNSQHACRPIERSFASRLQDSIRFRIIRQLHKIRSILGNPFVHTGRITMTFRTASQSFPDGQGLDIFDSREYTNFLSPRWYYYNTEPIEIEIDDNDLFGRHCGHDAEAGCLLTIYIAFFTTTKVGCEYIKTISEEESDLKIVSGFCGCRTFLPSLVKRSKQIVSIIERDGSDLYTLNQDVIETVMIKNMDAMTIIRDVYRIFSTIPTLQCRDFTRTVMKRILAHRFICRPFYYMQIDQASSCTIGYILPYEIRSLIADRMDPFY